ncbi:MAG: divalent-cation tolerance protein CutA [Thermoanaerobaculia bacterium]|nr:divalent-cation tolerance protein CutA [Thermoanaerobaculia bacterium]
MRNLPYWHPTSLRSGVLRGPLPLTGLLPSVTFAPVMSAIVMVTSVGDEEQANGIARELVLRRHAACVNILSGVKSVYRWQGKICRDSEYVLMIKTLESEYESVASTVRELHDYDLPEILAFGIRKGDEDFLDWIAQSLDKEAEFGDEEDLPDPEQL